MYIYTHKDGIIKNYKKKQAKHVWNMPHPKSQFETKPGVNQISLNK